jgi:hypothetical protein
MARMLLDEYDEILDFAAVLAGLQAHHAANKPKRLRRVLGALCPLAEVTSALSA